MAGKFELYQDASGKYRFRLKAGNGEIVATGEAYESQSAAKKGIEAVQCAAGATVRRLPGPEDGPVSAPASAR